MRALLSAVVLWCALVISHAAVAHAGTCSDPAGVSDCSATCGSLSACLSCCTTAHGTPSTCRLECAAFAAATTVDRHPSRPPRPVRIISNRPRPVHAAPTPTIPIDSSRFSATCKVELSGQDVVVTLTVANDTGSLLRSVLTEVPFVQAEAGTTLSLDRTPQPRSYTVLPTGRSVQFVWHGRLTSSGAAGISASAVASGANGEYLHTALADCGTVSAAPVRSPTPFPTSTPPAAPTATPCASCGSQSAHDFIAAKWATSAHASTGGPEQNNTFCASCHSPLQASAGATADFNQPIAAADWQNVTCSVCHPPAAQRTEWGTPIGTYDIATRTYRPVPLGDADVLCVQCHTGDHAPGFQNYGRIMHEAAVRCIDCHMAQIPASNPALGDLPAHDFKATENLPYSCGTYPGGCHSRRPESWAARILELGPIHLPKM